MPLTRARPRRLSDADADERRRVDGGPEAVSGLPVAAGRQVLSKPTCRNDRPCSRVRRITCPSSSWVLGCAVTHLPGAPVPRVPLLGADAEPRAARWWAAWCLERGGRTMDPTMLL